MAVNDYISRAEVLKLMQDNWHTHNGDWAMQESMDDIRVLPSVTPQELRWIPVGKKVPVAFEKVLVTYRLHYDDSIHVGIGNTTSNVNGRYYWNINEQDYIGWDILAWMPLPPCYEPQESEDKE